jgi:hypothetical protein
VGVWIAIVVMAALVTWRFRPAQPASPSSSKTDDLPPDVRRDLHTEAVRQNRQQLWFALLGVILAVWAVPTAYIIGVFRDSFYRLGETLIAAGTVLVWAVRTGLEWRRLRQIDPYQYDGG